MSTAGNAPMKTPNLTSRRAVAGMATAAVLVLAAGLWWQHSAWLPPARAWLAAQLNAPAASTAEDEAGHAAHDEPESAADETMLVLSEQGRLNIGLTDDQLQPVRLQDFTRMLEVPAIVVERPGQTHFQVIAPMTGVVTVVNAVRGESIEPERLMFRIRLTHEDLVQSQTSFLKTLGALDVEQREIKRLKELIDQGIIPGKQLLERQYQQQRLEADLKANHEALLLHGLSTEQVAYIRSDRRLISSLDVTAPAPKELIHPDEEKSADQSEATDSLADQSPGYGAKPAPLLVQSVNVSPGEFVQAGQALAVLADYSELYIEGRAFERDAGLLAEAARKKLEVQAVPESGAGNVIIRDLAISWLGNSVDTESRAFPFYVLLPNTIAFDPETDGGPRFLSWRFKPGQRMQLRVPAERWEDRIVLPVGAVVEDGADFFVFQQNGKRFERRPVHVIYRDQHNVVIANDGSLYPGDVVATTGAHQMQMALKNKSGGGVDPHAGHTH